VKRQTSRLGWSVVMTGVIIVGLSAPARASHQDNLPDPDNTTQCVKSPSIVPKTVIARDQGFAQLDRTDIDTQYCTGDDIWVQDYTYGATGWYAHTPSAMTRPSRGAATSTSSSSTKAHTAHSQTRGCDRWDATSLDTRAASLTGRTPTTRTTTPACTAASRLSRTTPMTSMRSTAACSSGQRRRRYGTPQG